MEWLHYAPTRSGLQTADVAIMDWHPKWGADFRRLNEEWITRYFVLEADDRRTLNDPEREVIAAGGAIVVAVCDGRAVGTGALLHEGEGVYELAKMAVTPEWQGRGIGRLVAERLLRIARERGAKKVELVSQSGLTPALTLYSSLGFRRVPVGAVTYQRADVRMELSDLKAWHP
jgi:GNAT superfamily N-acetyltransferase